MTIRFAGFIPAIALLAAGAAHAQSTGGGGQMAYPDPLPSGQVHVNAPTARDTGNMAYPAPSGGITTAAPSGPDTGSMQYPGGKAPAAGRTRGAAMKPGAMPASSAAAPAAKPTPEGMKAAAALAAAPGEAPVPYVDFGAPSGKPMAHGASMHHAPMHHGDVKKTSAATTAPTAAPAAPK